MSQSANSSDQLARQISGKPVYKRHYKKQDGRNLYFYGYAPHTGARIEGEDLEINAGAELRLHPLRKTWSIYAGHRNNRTFKPGAAANPLAPSQAGKPLTEIPFEGFELCVFENRFPVLHNNAHDPVDIGVANARASGGCEVIVYSPESENSLATLGQARRRLLLETWIDRYTHLFSQGCAFVLPFENRGDEVGVTLHHPHGQIYGFPFVPDPQQNAADSFEAGYRLHKKLGEWRSEFGIAEAGGMLAYAPPFARFPYEVWISGFQKRSGPWAFDEAEADGFAYLLGDIARRYDSMFLQQTPYMLSLHASPYGHDNLFEFTAQFYPLLRAQGRVKYLASVEQATGVFTVDIMPERAAKALRDVAPEYR